MAFPGADLPMLDLEKRTGVKDGDVEDFIARARDDAERARIRAEYEKREAARKVKEAAEEHEKWWSGAEYLFPEDETADDAAAADSIQPGAAGDETARERALRKYENDYA